MDDLTPLGDKVLAKMIDNFDGWTQKQSAAGLFMPDTPDTDGAQRPRWFAVTHIGPKQEDLEVGDYVLVANGRWSQGLDILKTGRKEDKLHYLDNEGTLAKTKVNPLD